MAKGLLIKAGKNATTGKLELIDEIDISTCVMQKGSSKLVITITFKDASVGEYDYTKINKNEVFIQAENEVDVKLTTDTVVNLEQHSYGSGSLEDTDITFTVRANKAGKVGGAGPD